MGKGLRVRSGQQAIAAVSRAVQGHRHAMESLSVAEGRVRGQGGRKRSMEALLGLSIPCTSGLESLPL